MIPQQQAEQGTVLIPLVICDLKMRRWTCIPLFNLDTLKGVLFI